MCDTTYKSCPSLASLSTSAKVFGGFISSPADISEKKRTHIWVYCWFVFKSEIVFIGGDANTWKYGNMEIVEIWHF